MLGRVIGLIRGNDQKVRSARFKRGDRSVETHCPSHLYSQKLSLTHNYFPDTSADEDNSGPLKDCWEANSRESTNKVTITRSKKKKKSTDPEYLYY